MGQDVDLHPARAERSQNVALHAVVDHRDSEPGPLTEWPPGQRRIHDLQAVDESFGHLADQVLFLERRDELHLLVQHREFLARPDDGSLSTSASQVPGKPPGVTVGDDRYAVAVQPFRQRLVRPPVLLERTELAGDQRPRPWSRRLLKICRGAVIPDEGIGHHHHLAGVRGVGEHLLVTGHAGVDHDLAARLRRLSALLTKQGESVFEDERQPVRHAAASARR